MIVVRRRTPPLFDQRRQRPSAASAAHQSPNAQQLPIGSREFRKGLEIERPLTPLNTLKPLMNNNFFVAAATTMMVVWRMTPRSLISGVSVHQRHQRPSNRQAANNYRLVLRNFGEVGNREAAEAADGR